MTLNRSNTVTVIYFFDAIAVILLVLLCLAGFELLLQALFPARFPEPRQSDAEIADLYDGNT